MHLFISLVSIVMFELNMSKCFRAQSWIDIMIRNIIAALTNRYRYPNMDK